LKQNKIIGALRNTRERARDKKMASKPGDKLEMPALDRGDSRRVPNSLNNGDKHNENLADKDSDWPILIPLGSHC